MTSRSGHQYTSALEPTKRRQRMLERCLDLADRFTLRQWETIALFYGEGLSISEVAKRLGVGRSAVGAHLRRVAERVRRGRTSS